MRWTPELTIIRDILSESYRTVDEIQVLIDDVGLPIQDISMANTVRIYWHNVIKFAVSRKDGTLGEIVRRCGREREKFSKQLQQVYDAYLNQSTDFISENDSLIDLIGKLRIYLASTTIKLGKAENGVEIFSVKQNAAKAEIEDLLKPFSLRSSPFVGPSPYSVTDSEFFEGRRNEIKYLADKLSQPNKRIAVIQSHGVGKTSFINAGLIPELLQSNQNHLILKFQNYDEPLLQIKDLIREIPDDFIENDLAGASSNSNKRPVIVIFDQFECSIPDEKRQSFFQNLQALSKTDYKILFSGRDDDDRLVAELANSSNSFEYEKKLLDFDSEKARKILEKILDNNGKLTHDTKFITELVKDCKQLSDNESFSLEILQIVCEGLFDKALQTNSSITEKFYKENNAEILLTDYLSNEFLKLGQLNLEKIGWRIMASLKTVGNGQTWGKVCEELTKFEKDAEKKVKETLDRLQKIKLVIKKLSHGEEVFFPAQKVYAEYAGKLIESGEYDKILVRQEFYNAWLVWERRGFLASKAQIVEFEKFGEGLGGNEFQKLFLLRSAVEHQLSAALWLENLRETRGAELVGRLQKYDPVSVSERLDLTGFGSAVRLFTEAADIFNPVARIREVSDSPEEWLSRKAVLAGKREIRQTAMLALTLVSDDPFRFIAKIQSNLAENFIQRVQRRAELAGTFLENLPSDRLSELNLPFYDHSLALMWRLVRRFDLHKIYSALIYGGLVGGLSYGLSFALLRNQNIDPEIIWSIVIGIMLSPLFGLPVALIACLMLIAKLAPLNPPAKKNRVDLSIIAVGAVGFAFINAVWLLIYSGHKAFSDVALWSVAGLIPGIGIGIGLKIKSVLTNNSGYWGAVVGGTAVFLLFSLFQYGLAGYSGQYMFLTDPNTKIFGSVCEFLPIISAGLVGLAIYIGIAYGVSKIDDKAKRNFLFE